MRSYAVGSVRRGCCTSLLHESLGLLRESLGLYARSRVLGSVILVDTVAWREAFIELAWDHQDLLLGQHG
jgi:hypothetical protein